MVADDRDGLVLARVQHQLCAGGNDAGRVQQTACDGVHREDKLTTTEHKELRPTPETESPNSQISSDTCRVIGIGRAERLLEIALFARDNIAVDDRRTRNRKQ